MLKKPPVSEAERLMFHRRGGAAGLGMVLAPMLRAAPTLAPTIQPVTPPQVAATRSQIVAPMEAGIDRGVGYAYPLPKGWRRVVVENATFPTPTGYDPRTSPSYYGAMPDGSFEAIGLSPTWVHEPNAFVRPWTGNDGEPGEASTLFVRTLGSSPPAIRVIF